MDNEELVARIQCGDTELMEQLYLNNKGFIFKIVRRFSYLTYVKYGNEPITGIDDLMQESYFGLHEAVIRYNPSEGCKFLTYAEHWIIAFIKRYIQNCGNAVRVPVHLQQKIYKYNALTSKYLRKYNREPSREEYRYYLKLDSEKLDKLERYMGVVSTVSLDSPVKYDDNETMTLGENISTGGFEEDVVEKESRRQIQCEVSELIRSVLKSNNLIKVIEGRYIHNKTLKEIGIAMGVSAERIKQLEDQGLRRLRSNSRTKDIGIEAGLLLEHPSFDAYSVKSCCERDMLRYLNKQEVIYAKNMGWIKQSICN